MRSRSPSYVCVVAVLALAISPAHAEVRTSAQREVVAELAAFHGELQRARALGNRAASEFRSTYDECLALVTRGQRLGIDGEEVIDEGGTSGGFPFKHARDRCEQWRTWQLLVRAAAAIAEAAIALSFLRELDLHELHGEAAQGLSAAGPACLVVIGEAIAAGAPSDVPVPVETLPMTLAEGEANVCTALARFDAGYARAIEQRQAAEVAANQRKYRAAGLRGAKLTLILDHGEATRWVGRGCGDAITAPHALARAPLLIHRVPTARGLHGIRKFRFKGNRLIRSEYREFARLEDALRWCR
jgi:hypothetical protein